MGAPSTPNISYTAFTRDIYAPAIVARATKFGVVTYHDEEFYRSTLLPPKGLAPIIQIL